MHIKKIYRNEASSARRISNGTHDIAAINAAAEATGFGEGDFKAIIGKLDVNDYSRGSIDIPNGISLEEFSRKYVGADATNKRVGTPCHITGCGTLDDGTEFVAYKSEGTGSGKKYRVTSLTTFVKIFGAVPVAKRSRNSVIGPDISEYVGKEYYDRRDVRNPRVHVVGSFISDEGRDSVVVEYMSGSDKYGWMAEGFFELNYKEMPV